MREIRSYGSVRGCVKNARKAQCCTRDEGGSFGAGLQEQASNSRKLLSSNGGGGERYGKGVSKSRHVRVRETNASEPLMRPRNRSTWWHQNRSAPALREEHGGNLVTGYAVSGVQVA